MGMGMQAINEESSRVILNKVVFIIRTAVRKTCISFQKQWPPFKHRQEFGVNVAVCWGVHYFVSRMNKETDRRVTLCVSSHHWKGAVIGQWT